MEEVGTLTGNVSSWQHLDAETKELAAKVKEGGSKKECRTGPYIVTARRDMVYVNSTNSDGEKQGEPLACFRAPYFVRAVSCRGTSVVVGCKDGQVVFLEAPLLADHTG
uniref:CNH domain-containing protein n=1 Tax=Hemiselmis andersenii TaxID=464988 RepID=A0A7S1DK04_HEMAN|mmetsp:Transcript_17855/g.43079  ORF Transcript_17855/g.43079 Transcript_17855/m.43079 type:complete len:109 (+) Transcript_17855:3-329(+)